MNFNLTREQQILLSFALTRRDVILATMANSPNDLVWMEFVEAGVLEIVDQDDKDWASLKNRLDLRGYRATENAVAASRTLAPVSIDQMHVGGTA